uniref:Reverse transcriptase domain-containing protein n=1 Tax=Tanacetum cinerariifolium TaxID=118510 RepID=A0A6L2MGP1_TANCI|nr:reverse transcriptase domain-containing protein [Tanacetum cinerariifolium]
MSTRSSVRNLFPPLDNLKLTIRKRSRVDPTLLNDFKMATNGNGDDVPPPRGGDLPVPGLQTMEELCQPTLNGRGRPFASIAIQAMNFGLKNDMIQQVQNSCQLHGLPGDDANKHLDKFLYVTQSIKVNGVTDDALRLAKVTAIEKAKDLATLPLDEINGYLNVYDMVLDNDGVASKTTKEKVKSLAIKAKVTRE